MDYGMGVGRGEGEMWEENLGRVVGAAKWRAVVLEGRERGCVCGEGCEGFGECVGRLGEWYGCGGKGGEEVDGEAVGCDGRARLRGDIGGTSEIRSTSGKSLLLF